MSDSEESEQLVKPRNFHSLETGSTASDESALLIRPYEKSKKKFSNNVGWRRVFDFFTKNGVQATIFAIIFVVVVVLFALNEEEPLIQHNLIAVSNDTPYTYKFQGSTPYVAVDAIAQRIEMNVHTNDSVIVTIEVDSGHTCVPENPDSKCRFQLDLNTNLVTTLHKLIPLDATAESTVLSVTSNDLVPVALDLTVGERGGVVEYQVLIAGLILVAVYVLIVFELVHRTIAAMFGAFIALATLSNIHARPSFQEVITWIDWNTCGLLFGMMIMVGIFSTTGFFEYCAIQSYRLSGGNLWRLVVMLCVFTAVVSAFLDNVTTILLLTPVTIRLCTVLDIDPINILLALIMFSNVGGTMTAIGDPPNIIIVSDKRIQATGKINFGTFMLNMVPGVVITLVATFFIVRRWFHSRIDRQPHQAKQLELRLWKQTAKRLRGGTDEEQLVLQQLHEHIKALEEEIAAGPGDDNQVKQIDIGELEQKYGIRDKTLFINSSIVLGGVIFMFILESIVELHLSLAWIAIIGSIMHLLVAGVKDIDTVLEHVEWGTLMFFAALFILMHSLERMNLIAFIGEQLSNLIETVPEGGDARLAAAVTLIIWVSGIASAFIDNIPFTTAMVPVIVALSERVSLPIEPLVWSLSFGACFGGNGTLIAASANVVCAGLAEQAGYNITFNQFFKKGFPVMLVSLLCANVYMLIFHVLIPWT